MQKETREVRWGILGCAAVAAQVIIPGIQLSRNGVVAAVASRDIAKAQTFRDRFQIPTAYGSYEELLADPTIEAVHIPLPNSLHKEWTIKTALNGKHVLCEKPLASNAEEAQEMVNACATNGVLLMEAFAQRFHLQNVLAKTLIDEGRIGRVMGITAVHSSGRPQMPNDIRLNKNLRGGVLEDKGCYCIDTARFLLATEPVSVFAAMKIGAESGVDERVTALIEFPDEARFYFDTSFLLETGQYQQGYEVLGASGRIAVPFGFTQVQTYRRGEIIDTIVSVTDQSGRTEVIPIKGDHHWKLEVEYFADLILNRKPLSFPGGNGLSNMKVIDAIYRSARTGSPVSLEGPQASVAGRISV
jgi:D-xylose 1-dehydrogenase (NADP+, D-xylono-1,5-lactone-forming)